MTYKGTSLSKQRIKGGFPNGYILAPLLFVLLISIIYVHPKVGKLSYVLLIMFRMMASLNFPLRL